jgi:hypothetical protein
MAFPRRSIPRSRPHGAPAASGRGDLSRGEKKKLVSPVKRRSEERDRHNPFPGVAGLDDSEG